MAARSWTAWTGLVVGMLWAVEKTSQGVAGGARWMRSRLTDGSSEPVRSDPDQGGEGRPPTG